MGKMSAWWSSFGFGKGEVRPDTDYGDMGTAFGLDASFGREGATAAPRREGFPPPPESADVPPLDDARRDAARR